MTNFLSKASRLRFWIMFFLIFGLHQNTLQPDYIHTVEYLIIQFIFVVLAFITFWGRANDAGKSGWFSLLMLIPILNFYAIYILGFYPSKKSK